jgi:type IV pilus assembly protein PilB
MNNDLREMIVRNCTSDELRVAARRYGMVTLRDAGMDYVYQGKTTLEEVVRETIVDG